MTVNRLRRWLLEHPLVRNLTPSHLASIVGCAEARELARGDYVCRRGDAATAILLVRRGRIVLDCAAEGAVATTMIGDGGVLGWAWWIRNYRWPADGHAVEPTELIALDAGCLRRKCHANPKLGDDLVRRFSIANRVDPSPT